MRWGSHSADIDGYGFLGWYTEDSITDPNVTREVTGFIFGGWGTLEELQGHMNCWR
jgi:hypothetical protein